MKSSTSRCQRFRARIIQSSCHVIFFFPLFIFYLSCFFVVGWSARCCVVVVVVRNNRIECQSLRGTTSPGPAHAGSYHLFLSSLDFYPKPIHPSWPPTQGYEIIISFAVVVSFFFLLYNEGGSRWNLLIPRAEITQGSETTLLVAKPLIVF